MILENEKCHIEIRIDKTYTVGSADNRHYDVTLNPGHHQRNDMPRTLSIHIDLFSRDFHIALIGPFHSYDSDCAILDDEILTVLQGNMITQIKITDASIVRNIMLDCFGCNFAIYKVNRGYIIYGEIEITMLDFEFKKKWSFSGKDIFVSISDKEPFAIREKTICLCDFENNYYEIDFDGKLIM